MRKVRSLLTPLVIGGLVGAAAGATLHFSRAQTMENPVPARPDAGSTSQEADAVLGALETIADPLVARAAALEIAAALGGGSDDIERIAPHLRRGARLGFRAEAYARWAARDASAALAAAIMASANPAEQWTLLQRIALELSRTAPEAAWSAAAGIADGDQRGAFRAAVLAEWALVAPEAAVDFLERVDAAEVPVDLDIPDRLIATDPERLLAASARLRLRVRLDARRRAFEALAARDPERALELLSALMPQTERNDMRTSLARGYGAHDANAALAWAAAQPDASNLAPAVVSGIASVDFSRALGLIVDAVAARRQEAAGWASSVMNGGVGPDEARRLLDALAANADAESASVVASTLYIWARDDGRSAVDWLLANLDEISAEAAGSVANIVARADPELAIGAAARLPSGRRGDWISNVVRTVGVGDADRALALLEQYRGEPFFAEAIRAIAAARILQDPAGAARMLTQADAAATPTGARIAGSWAVQDPAAAAAWVSAWPAGEAHRESVRRIAEQWGQRDFEAGLAFALSLQAAERDAALAGLAEGAARIGITDDRVFASFGSDEAKLAAADRAVMQLGTRYPQRAQKLIESITTDPARRLALETTLARTLMSRFTP